MADPIRVLFIISNLGRGGAEKQLVTLLDHLDGTVVQARLICISRTADEYWSAFVRDQPNIDAVLMPPGHSQSDRLRLIRRQIAEFRPQIVWGWSFFTSLYALPFCWGKRIKMVASLRNDGRYLLKENWWAPWFMRYADAAVANTHCAFRELNQLKIKTKKQLVLPNIVGLPEEAATPSDPPRRVGYCGNFHHRKGLDVLVRAAALVLAQGVALKFVLAGRGDSRELQAQVAALGLVDHFEFPGEVPCAEYVRQLDLFILPSRHEGCPNVLLETMALGIPCIGTKVGGIPEIIEDGKNGYLVPAEDEAALAEAILRAWGDGLARAELGRAGLASMRKDRDANFIAKKVFVQVLEEILI